MAWSLSNGIRHNYLLVESKTANHILSIGADSAEIVPRYITFMIYLSFSDDPDSNHYASPLPLLATVLADDFTFVSVTYTPIFGGESTKTIEDLDGPFPWEKYVANEYSHKIRAKAGEKDRQDLKPYRVLQPEGASVSILP